MCAVSYTHLDVYKRQELVRGYQLRMGSLMKILSTEFIMFSENNRIEEKRSLVGQYLENERSEGSQANSGVQIDWEKIF